MENPSKNVKGSKNGSTPRGGLWLFLLQLLYPLFYSLAIALLFLPDLDILTSSWMKEHLTSFVLKMNVILRAVICFKLICIASMAFGMRRQIFTVLHKSYVSFLLHFLPYKSEGF